MNLIKILPQCFPERRNRCTSATHAQRTPWLQTADAGPDDSLIVHQTDLVHDNIVDGVLLIVFVVTHPHGEALCIVALKVLQAAIETVSRLLDWTGPLRLQGIQHS